LLLFCFDFVCIFVTLLKEIVKGSKSCFFVCQSFVSQVVWYIIFWHEKWQIYKHANTAYV